MGTTGKILTALILAIALSSPVQVLAQEKLESSETCKPCHLQIYYQWAKSRHASSFTEPFFRMTFEEISKENPENAKKCITCHSPTTLLPEAGGEKLANEGVTCDFCHTVKEVDTSSELPHFVNTPGTRRGPVEDADTSFHRTAFSSLHLDSKFCGSCHDYVNPHGIKVLSTYSEWKESFYRGEEIQCQYCHLPELYRDLQYQEHEVSTRPPDHTMKGGHFPSQLRDSLKGKGEIAFTGNKAIVTLYLTNDKSGHMIPTGIPTHRVVISVVIFDERGNRLGEGETYLERVLGDGRGNPIEKPADMFLNAREVLSDNRVGPKETRKITLTIPLKGVFEKVHGTASLFYELPSPDPNLKRVRIKFSDISLEEERWNRTVLAILLIVLVITILLVGYDVFLRLKKRN